MSSTFHFNPTVAERLYARYTSAFSHVNIESNEDSSPYSPSPITPTQLQTPIEVSFWASLVQEEGRRHDFSLFVCPKEFTSDSFVFESGLRFEARQLAKLAPALKAQENSIGVWLDDNAELFIWGFTPSAETSLSVKAYEPGQLQVSFHYGEVSFTALVSGSRTEFVDASNRHLKRTPPDPHIKRFEDYKQATPRLDTAVSRTSDHMRDCCGGRFDERDKDRTPRYLLYG